MDDAAASVQIAPTYHPGVTCGRVATHRAAAKKPYSFSGASRYSYSYSNGRTRGRTSAACAAGGEYEYRDAEYEYGGHKPEAIPPLTLLLQ